MTRTLAVDANNDLYLGRDGNLAVATEIDATALTAGQAAKAIRGEMVLNADQGMPYFEVVWNGSPNLVQAEAALRARLLAVEGVRDITSLTTRRAGDRFTYVATLETIYGAVAING